MAIFGTQKRAFWSAACATAGFVVAACNLITHVDDYAVGASDDGGSADGATPGAGDCGAQSPQSQFTTTCTSAMCVPFDDGAHVVSGLLADGGLPPLPEAGSSGGGGGSDAGTDASEAGSPYPPCSSLTNPVYLMGSNAMGPIVQQLGTWANDVGITLVYTSLSSCKGVSGIVQNVDALTAGATTSTYWDTGSNAHTCAIDPGSKYADIGLSSVFMDTCIASQSGFSGVADFQGPVVTAVWFVPHTSTQTSLSAEAAYLLYSGAGKVSPWEDPKFVFLRGPTGGTQVMMGKAIGVPPAQWVGVTTNSSDVERSDVISSTNPQGTLGLGEIDYAEDAVGSVNLNELAYRHYGQSCAYYPNSTATSRDKRNVRDGHYVGWGPVHLIARVNAQGVPVNAAAGQIINYFIGNAPLPNHDFLSLVIAHHLVPQCAMKVRRTTEVGPVEAYTPTPGCSCYFDSITARQTDCQACTASAECPATAPVCNLGFCEPR